MKDRLPSKYAAATRRIDIVCGKYSADAWGSSVAMTAHGAKQKQETPNGDSAKRRIQPFGDNRRICRVRTPKLSFKFSISTAHRDPIRDVGNLRPVFDLDQRKLTNRSLTAA